MGIFNVLVINLTVVACGDVSLADIVFSMSPTSGTKETEKALKFYKSVVNELPLANGNIHIGRSKLQDKMVKECYYQCSYGPPYWLFLIFVLNYCLAIYPNWPTGFIVTLNVKLSWTPIGRYKLLQKPELPMFDGANSCGEIVAWNSMGSCGSSRHWTHIVPTTIVPSTPVNTGPILCLLQVTR